VSIKVPRLEALDSRFSRDIVDTTSVHGNFIKMLVGAVRDDYDEEDSESEPPYGK